MKNIFTFYDDFVAKMLGKCETFSPLSQVKRHSLYNNYS